MPLSPDTRRKIDQIRDYLFGGGYPDPMNNAEQLAFLFYFYLSEGQDKESTARARIAKQTYASLFAGEWTLKNPLNAPKEGQKTIPKENLRWSIWARAMSGENLVRFVRDEVFLFYAEMAERYAVNFMEGGRLGIDDPTVLTQVINLVDELRLDQADADTKGDLFEHVLKQISQAGELGQFRTPRHIIRAIVQMIAPQIGETIYDPAAGTAGFLVAAYDYIRLNNSSPNAIEEVELDNKKIRRGHGDKLSAAKWDILGNRTFYGNDVDLKMVHLATMNLTLRGLPNVRIRRRNVLTTTLDAQQKADLGLPLDGFKVILANPPFSGRLDKDRIVDDVKIGTSTATELLFLKYMIDSLKLPSPASGRGAGGEGGGRCGVIVPEGVLFGSTGAHKELRRQLIENNRVEAVLTLPGGVFQPYSGVKTSVLFFRKGGATERVLFLHADNDGYKLDAKHDTPIEDDDLPGLLDAYQRKDKCWAEWRAAFLPSPASGGGAGGEGKPEWPHKWWFADAATLRANDFNLSAGRYRPMSQAAVEHRDPRELLDELAAIEAEIVEEVEALRLVLANGNA
jgi:type I restriction enzyme M protein